MKELRGKVVANEGGYWVVDMEDSPRYLSRLFIDPPSCNLTPTVGMRVKLKYTTSRTGGLWRIVAELPEK